jgi:hypothetical protein
MEARVTRIEVAFEHVRKDLDELKADMKLLKNDLGSVLQRLTKMPTSTEMWGMYAAVTALAFAVLGIILGALAYLKP